MSKGTRYTESSSSFNLSIRPVLCKAAMQPRAIINKATSIMSIIVSSLMSKQPKHHLYSCGAEVKKFEPYYNH